MGALGRLDKAITLHLTSQLWQFYSASNFGDRLTSFLRILRLFSLYPPPGRGCSILDITCDGIYTTRLFSAGSVV